MTDFYQLSTQIEQLMRRMDVVEAQVAALSHRLGVPYTSAAPGAAFDPRLTSSAGPAAWDTPAGPMSAMLGPVPQPVAGPVPGPPGGAPADPQVAGITPEIIDLVRRGKKINAIRLYRELTGVDLKTAKDVIDSL